MAKKRKTKEQKKLADLRHDFSHTFVIKAPSETRKQLQSNKVITSIVTEQNQTHTNSYPYLAKDLSKTAVLTAVILTLQIILFAALKNHILTIPGLTY